MEPFGCAVQEVEKERKTDLANVYIDIRVVGQRLHRLSQLVHRAPCYVIVEFMQLQPTRCYVFLTFFTLKVDGELRISRSRPFRSHKLQCSGRYLLR